MLLKYCTQCDIKFGKLISGHRTGNSFHSNPTEDECQRMFTYCTVALTSHASKVMLTILQARLQQYMNQELPGVQADLERQRNQRSNSQCPLDHRKSTGIPKKHLFH